MKKWLKYCLFILTYTIVVAICFVLPDFLDNPTNGLKGISTIAAYVLAISGASFFLLYLFGINKHIFAIFLPTYAIFGTIVAFYRFFYKATITPALIECTIHTNAEEVSGVVSWQLITFVIISLVIAIGFVIYRYKKIEAPTPKWLHAFFALALFFGYYFCNSRLHQSINQRYPMNIVYNFIEYAKMQHDANIERIPVKCEQVEKIDSLNVIFVLGEAVRADHLSLNGYYRETCPKLSQNTNVISFRNIYSEYTYTSASVPHILTCADSASIEKAYSTTSFIHNFNQNGFTSAWMSNQDMNKTYTSFIHEADTIIFPNADKSVFVFSEWYDEQLLQPIDSLMSKNYAKNLYILHTIGSHWYYNNHVPDQYQIFQPTTTNRVVTNNDSIAVVNAYDNTIVAIDAFISQVIERFEDKNAILIYLSDHGESLGENNCWLHASGAEETKYPACIVWFSNQYATQFPEKIKALQANCNKHYHTDFLFYSILSAAGMQAEGDNPMVDIFLP